MIPDVAFGRVSDSFPTLAVEVGFSELWPSLLENALLFLTGTEDVTKVVLLIKLVEKKPYGDYVNPMTGQKIKCCRAKANMFRWPGSGVEKEEAQNGDPASEEGPANSNDHSSRLIQWNGVLMPPAPSPPDPKDVDNNLTLAGIEYLLETYFLATDNLNLLFPP